MSALHFDFDDEFMSRFKDAVYKKYGMKRGNMKMAVQEAMEQWMTSDQ